MRRIMMSVGVLVPAVLLATSGCVATRNWVQETVGRRTTEIDQKVTTVATERRQDAARIDDQGKRLDGVEVSVRDGAQKLDSLTPQVTEATKSASDARTRADEVDGRLTRLWDKRNVRNLSESFTVKFRFNRADLDDAAQTTLVPLVRDLQQNPKLMIELEGYADPKGDRDYNVQLSQRRVESVRRYLVQNGIELSRILSIGLGPVDDPKTPDASKRRVIVKVLVPAE